MKPNNNEPTMSYRYGNNDQEFVFCHHGRPFPCLVSPHLPTPTASLIDYHLVRDLGLKMTDLQCQKFSYCGFKMRILGKISITVQCIHDGVSSGTFHIKGNVVLDLAKHLDTECVAGAKMAAQLKGDVSPAPSTPTRAAPSPAPSVPSAKSPRTPSTRAPQSPRSPPRSPPGFPPRPQHAASPGGSIPDSRSEIPVLRVSSTGRAMSPRTANVCALSTAFRDADVMTDFNKELYLIGEADSDGELVEEDDGNVLCNFTNGLVYQFGHGRDKCTRINCSDRNENDVKEKPSNCGYNQQWWLPAAFTPCGEECRGAFCRCLQEYNNLGHRDVKKGKWK